MSGSRTFRLFVSSTFADLKAERNALQQHVFPRLKRLCLHTDCRFQDIDLRWGISEEAGLDQRTMRICLQEVARCQETTPRPNFVVLLGDRYGWRPLPFEIAAAEFEAIESAARGEEPALLARWYRLDENAVPPVFRLQPRERGTPTAQYATWRDEVEQPLSALLGRVNAAYNASATEQEIEAGALALGADQHVFGFLRTIADFPARGAKDFRDVLADGTPDGEPAARLLSLKDRLGRRLGRNVAPYSATWLSPEQWSLPPDAACDTVIEQLLRALQNVPAARAGLDEREWDGLQAVRDDLLRGLPAAPPQSGASRPAEASPITLDHVPALCADLLLRLGWIILREIAGFAATDPVQGDRDAHRDFGAYRSRNFIGRKATLHAIEDYLRGDWQREGSAPLAVVGESGSGKTALLAHAAERVAQAKPGAEVVVRFVGATPESADGRSLLLSICRDIARRYRLPETEVPEDYRALARQFPERLAAATAKQPLALFLDALDMLSAADRAKALGWLPRRLPPHVALVVSTTPGEGQAAVERRLGAGHVQLDTLSLYEGARLLRRWLGDAKRRLTRQQRRVIMEGFSHTRLPLYLKLAFEAARDWDSTLEVEPLGPQVPDLIRALFDRLSEAGNHGEELTSRSLSYLAAARHGLTEDEILDVLSRDPAVMQSFRDRSPESPAVTRLPVVVWSRLYQDLQVYLARQRADGTTVFSFYHQQVKRVAEAAYLSGSGGRARHADLARYYEDDARLSVEAAGGRVYNLRKLAEQPYQQSLSHRWDELSATLGSLDFLQAKVEAGAGYDAMADFERAARLLPDAPRFEDDPHERSRALLREFGNAFNQEANAFLSRPESTGQQIYHNLFAHTGLDGPGGELLRRFPGPRAGTGAWLRRLNLSPRTSIPRALLRTLPAHAAEVTALAVSPDGCWIASGARDGEIRVFQRSDGAEAAGFRIEDGSVAGLVWIGGPAEPLRLVSAGQSGRLTIWDWEAERAESGGVETGTRSRAISALGDGRVVVGGDDRVVSAWKPGDPRPVRLYNHQDRVLCVAADRETGLVISGGADRTVRLWSAGNPTPPLKGHAGPVRAVALDGAGGRAVSGDEAGVVRIWNVADHSERRVITAHAQRVTCLGFLAKAEQVLSGSADTTIKSWDATTGQPLATLRAHTRPVSCLATAPAGEWFVSAGEDATVRVWQAETERRPPAEAAEHEGAITTLVELADGRVASGSEDGTIRIWGPDGLYQATLRGHVGPISSLLALPGRIVSGSADRGIRLWRLDGSNRVELWGRPVVGLAQSPSGPEVIGDSRGARSGSEPGAGHSGTVRSLLLAGDRVLSAGDDGALRAWELESGRPRDAYAPVTGGLAALLLLDEWVAGCGTPREVLLWPRRGGEIHRRLEGHESSVSCLASLGGDRLASGGLDGTLRVWSAANGAGRVRWTHPSRVNCLAADPATGMLASGDDDGSVLLGPLADAMPRRLSGHSAPVRALTLRSGVLTSAGDDGRINLWSAAEGTLVVSASLGSAVTALLPQHPNRLWAGTRGATVALLALELGGGR